MPRPTVRHALCWSPHTSSLTLNPDGEVGWIGASVGHGASPGFWLLDTVGLGFKPRGSIHQGPVRQNEHWPVT